MNLAEKINKLKKYIDVAYLIALVLYVACYACDQSAVQLAFLKFVFVISSFVLVIVAVYRLISVLTDKSNNKLFSVVVGIAAFLMVALYIFSLCTSDNSYLTILPYALIGAMGVKADQILFSCIGGNIVMIFYNLVLVLAGKTGTRFEERDFIFFGDNVFNVSRLNSNTLTDLAAHYFWIIAAYLWIRGKKITWFEIIALGALDILVYSLTGSNTTLLTISLVLLLAVCIRIYTIIDRKCVVDEMTALKVISKILSFCSRYSFLIVAALCIGLAIVFNTGSSLMVRIDSILHNRIAYGHRGLMELGISFLPREIKAYGIDNSADGYYFFLDCSYLSLLIRYGILFLAFFLGCMTFVQNRFKKYLYGTIILGVCALACIEEPRLMGLPYNFFILLIFADKNIEDKFTFKTEKSNSGLILSVCSTVLCVGLLGGSIFINYPRYKAVKKLVELDQKAGSIYSAVQLNIDMAVALGDWEGFITNNSSYQFGDVLGEPSDFSAVTGLSWNETISNPKVHSYYSVSYGNGSNSFAVSDILINDKVKNLIGDGSVVIEYDAVSGKVYSVWYSETEGCVAVDDGRDYTRAGRLRDDVVPEGYYAGGVNG